MNIELSCNNRLAIKVASEAIKQRGPHFEEHSIIFCCYVNAGLPVPKETMHFLAAAFDSFNDWSETNDQKSNRERNIRLAQDLHLTLNGKGNGKKNIKPSLLNTAPRTYSKELNAMTRLAIGLAKEAIEKRGPHFEGHSSIFSCYVKTGLPVQDETMQFLVNAFNSFNAWSETNKQETDRNRRQRLAQYLQLALNGNGRKKNTKPYKGTDFYKLWKKPNNRAVLQLEELVQRKAEGLDRQILTLTELRKCAAHWGNLDPDTLGRYRQNLKEELVVEFSSRAESWQMIARSIGFYKRHYFFKSCQYETCRFYNADTAKGNEE